MKRVMTKFELGREFHAREVLRSHVKVIFITGHMVSQGLHPFPFMSYIFQFYQLGRYLKEARKTKDNQRQHGSPARQDAAHI